MVLLRGALQEGPGQERSQTDSHGRTRSSGSHSHAESVSMGLSPP